MIKLEHNVISGEVSEIEMSEIEIEQLKKITEEHNDKLDAIQKEIEESENAKWQAKKEVLDRLGLTIEEAKILLG